MKFYLFTAILPFHCDDCSEKVEFHRLSYVTSPFLIYFSTETRWFVNPAIVAAKNKRSLKLQQAFLRMKAKNYFSQVDEQTGEDIIRP